MATPYPARASTVEPFWCQRFSHLNAGLVAESLSASYHARHGTRKTFWPDLTKTAHAAMRSGLPNCLKAALFESGIAANTA